MPRPVRALLFDLDGTLTRPVLDFQRIRVDLGMPADAPSILDWVNALADATAMQLAHEVLHRHELLAAQAAEPNAGFDALVAWIAAAVPSVQVAVVTRNCRPASTITLERLRFAAQVVVTREDATPKPAPDAILLALQQLGAAPDEAVMVGDYRDDIIAARAAGVAHTVFVSNGDDSRDPADASHIARDLAAVAAWLADGRW
ncbi:MAG: HAD family hydrolase [Planctomycetota bacterium]